MDVNSHRPRIHCTCSDSPLGHILDQARAWSRSDKHEEGVTVCIASGDALRFNHSKWPHALASNTEGIGYDEPTDQQLPFSRVRRSDGVVNTLHKNIVKKQAPNGVGKHLRPSKLEASCTACSGDQASIHTSLTRPIYLSKGLSALHKGQGNKAGSPKGPSLLIRQRSVLACQRRRGRETAVQSRAYSIDSTVVYGVGYARHCYMNK